ncbi:hypothetical protein OS190_17475 [Sulfitobacter sp. F26204]|uniref:hypothetical protein n=1 Tax=Sulfitobacter sp. F26204 TaxID=2996014 RepID=UPI00225E262A|nr:hypothetical protein [Sulfitobacter sp. F26204]MCX7561361.1 hypothetical protein [Sulfitobacter sp. F26204]
MLVSLATTFFVGTVERTSAQTYPIDCAILLCLSGGWPASVPCSRARAEFIRRITPWPVEPPLQIWRCPMGASYDSEGTGDDDGRIYDILFDRPRIPLLQTIAVAPSQEADLPPTRVISAERVEAGDLINDFTLRLVKDRADIDISGPEFSFVRSIRVFDVRYAHQYQAGSEGDCERSAVVVLGTYGTQGDFSWRRSSISTLPKAHVGLERWGENCPSIHHRSVFVDWRDYEGNYGYEQANY